jgi:hypothetical protein
MAGILNTADLKFVCHHCQTDQCFEAGNLISKSDECSHCKSDLRVCLNCQFYDPQRNRECREHIPERINEKSKRNSCEFFRPNLKSSLNQSSGPNDLKKKQLELAEALFKKK